MGTTNYDRIRNMSIEEMAVLLMCPAEIDCTFEKPDNCKEKNCCKCTLEWLESEVKE